MARIARDSGGAVLGDDPAGEIRRDFETRLQHALLQRAERVPAWDRAWVFVAIVALWGVTWTLRRSWGLT
jgi:hypothetical protein